MKGLCRLALAALFVAACGGNDAITGPNSREQLMQPPNGGPVLATGVDSTTGATIVTNKDDYMPGEVVHVSGHGWAPNETVNLHMTEEPNTHADVDTNVVADDTGAFSVHYYDVQQHDLGVTFTLTATGQTSHSVAVAVFTDGAWNLTINSFSPTSPAPSALFDIAGTIAITGSGANTWKASQWWIDTGTKTCVDLTPDVTKSPPNSEAFALTGLTAPPATGPHTLWVQLWETDDCSDPTGPSNGKLGGEKSAVFTVAAPPEIGTTTLVTASPVSPTVFGQSVTFTAAVTPASGPAATGTVRFYDFSGVIDCSTATGELGTDTSAPFEYTTSSLSVGAHRIWACFDADAGWTDSNDDVSHTVNQADVSVSVGASPASPTNVGDNVTFTATVTAASPGSGTPTGTVTFYDGACGSTQIGSPDNSAPFEVSTSALTAGSHTITACYGGDANFNSGSGSTSHSVALVGTTTTISSQNNPSVTGQQTTYTATVKRTSDNSNATGSVTFKTGGTSCTDVAATVLSGPTALVAGQAQAGPYSYTPAQSGLVVRACFSDGGVTFADSEDNLTQLVNKANTGATATDSDDPSVFGQSITLGTTVTVTAPGAGVPTGNVKFYELTSGDCSAPVGTQLGSTQSLSGVGTASVSYSGFSVGSHTITVCYEGDANFNGSTNSTTHQINKAQTTLTLATNSPTTFGSQATFTATISVNSPGAGTPGGNVQFNDGGTCNADGTITGGSALSSVAITSGQAILNTNNLDAGTHTIVACYGGDGNFLGDGDSQSHVVNALSTSLTLSVAPNSQQYSDKSVFKVSITPAEANTSPVTPLDGSVSFYVNGVTATCGNAPPSGAVGSVAITDLDNGVDSITYTIDKAASSTAYVVTACFYPSTTNFTKSSDNKTLTVTKEDATVYDETGSAIQINGTATVTFKYRETNGSIATETNSAAQKTAGLVDAGDLWPKATYSVTAKGVLNNNTITPTTCNESSNDLTGYSEIVSVTCTFSSMGVADTYDVDIDITGNYYDGAGATLIQVTDPNAGFATGGGWFWYNGVVGGEKVNFGFMAKVTVNNKKTNYQGSLLVIRHKANGDIIKVKSNVFDGYSIGQTSNNCTPASFSGKATYSLNGTSLGNYAFAGYGLDCGEPGTSDKFGLYQAYTPAAGGEIGTSTTAAGLAASAKTISGGNIQVPQPGGR